ncbi:PEP-CTERM-box response regulator transcription factor [Hydrogenophaga intermedia]|uniref:PEP-CTERM-box response regulator transcription factor n=1 Tax=Hydrogenophaga intermedia TaxID=65786 RepID=UPI002044C5DC|nr:PEP-CTERM-box response regulator transcription factor [Hydrogenophaga intermedia]MCM3563245.1 PEP-CTERM-box response regulator transcription factor [Hydrogenophaga intermedia]
MSAEKGVQLLIVEDDPALQKQIKWSLDQFESVTADDRESALVQLRRHAPAVVTMDLGLPPNADDSTEGFLLLEQIVSLAPGTKVVVLTGQNGQANALRAVELGAYDFLAKPFEPEVLGLIVQRALRLHELQAENERLVAMRQPDSLSGLLTRDPEMLRVCRTMEKVATTNATVMLLGESGTGKEVLARGLHDSSRRKGRFVAINCAAIPENLLESELFGYEKGAFTGAVKTTPGKIESAHGGTLMLDEIGDLPMALQAKLLRFLQERVIDRVGGRQEIPVDVRVVCATHQDVKQLISEGRFREDLFYRLAEIVINIPPLRDRVGDAAFLAHAFTRRFAQEQGRRSLTLSSDAVNAISAHRWPGNIRELENCIKRAVIMTDGNQVTAEDLALPLPANGAADEVIDLRTVRDEAEKRAVITALSRANNNVLRAAELLGVSRPTLYDLMHRFGMK